MQILLLSLIIILMCGAITWIGFRVVKQWNRPNNMYRAQMEDIERRKRELGIADENNEE